jgi:hypothetical protein
MMLRKQIALAVLTFAVGYGVIGMISVLALEQWAGSEALATTKLWCALGRGVAYFVATVASLVVTRQVLIRDATCRTVLSKVRWGSTIVSCIIISAVVIVSGEVTAQRENNVRIMTDDTSWSVNGRMHIVYVDRTNRCLYEKEIRRGAPTIIVPRPVKTWLLSADLTVALYSDDLGERHLYNRNTGVDVVVWPRSRSSEVLDLSISPSGDAVAFLLQQGKGVSALAVARVGARIEMLPNVPPVGTRRIAWSEGGQAIFVESSGKYYSYGYSKNMKSQQGRTVSRDSVAIHQEWGRFRYGEYRGTVPLTGFPTSSQNLHYCAVARPLRARRIVGYERGRELLSMSFVGPLNLGTRSFLWLSMVGESSEFLFESGQQLFLCDVRGRRVALVADGWDAIQLTGDNQRGTYF